MLCLSLNTRPHLPTLHTQTQSRARCVFLNYYPLFKVPVLVALNSANTAAQLEAMSDAEVVADAMAVSVCHRVCL